MQMMDGRNYNLLILIIFLFIILLKFTVFACLFKTHSLVDYECTWLCLLQKRVGYTKSKKSLKIRNGQSESVYRTDNTMGEKCTKDKRRSTKHAYKINDRVTRTPLKIEDELMCSGRVSSSCSTSGTRRVNLVTNPVTSMFLFLSYFSSVICFINKELLLTQKLLNLGFLAVKLKSSLPTFHGHDVNRCGISVLLLVPLVEQDLLTRPKVLPGFQLGSCSSIFSVHFVDNTDTVLSVLRLTVLSTPFDIFKPVLLLS